jgi:acetylornithine/succinyldiaminopimelate/putrescine aminotransferase
MDGYRAYSKHVNPGLGRFLELTGRDLQLVHASDGTVEEAHGRRLDDWISGFGSLNLGHNPAVVKAAIRKHLENESPNLYIESLNPYAGLLAERLIAAAGPAFETVFFSNSGSEAVEAAIKTAIATKRKHCIAYAQGGYHGTTLGALACMAHGSYREDFETVLGQFKEVPFGNLNALEDVLRAGDIAAFLLEPIQVEAGIRIAEPDYLRGVREVCSRCDVLLIFDEVQTGMGRTGSLFAWQNYGVVPDLFSLAKSLGGGLMPIGATVIAGGIWTQAFGTFRRSEIHNSTFGGNALACVAALATLDAINNPAFLSRVRDCAEELFSHLERSLKGCRMVAALPWKGLLGGIRLHEGTHPWLRPENLGLRDFEGLPMSGIIAVERLARRNILAQVCGHDWSVVRIEPPLTVQQGACNRFVEAVSETVRWMEKNV